MSRCTNAAIECRSPESRSSGRPSVYRVATPFNHPLSPLCLGMPRQPKARIPKWQGIPPLQGSGQSLILQILAHKIESSLAPPVRPFPTSIIPLLEWGIHHLRKSDQLESLGHRIGSDSIPVQSGLATRTMHPTKITSPRLTLRSESFQPEDHLPDARWVGRRVACGVRLRIWQIRCPSSDYTLSSRPAWR